MSSSLTRPVYLQVCRQVMATRVVIFETTVDVYKRWSRNKEKMLNGGGVVLSDTEMLHVAKTEFRNSQLFQQMLADDPMGGTWTIDACLAD